MAPEALDPPELTIDLAQPAPQPAQGALAYADPEAFSARIWHAPPGTPANRAPKVSDRSKPLKLQLIGIIKDGERLEAVLYDPETDQLLIVKNGDRVKQHTVTAIGIDTVELSDGRSTTRLSLKEDRS